MLNVLMRASVLALFASCFLAGCASQPIAHRTPGDPWERVNRSIWGFDMAFARKVALPVGHTYKRVTPRFVQSGIGNFFDNALYPIVFVNDLLQGKLKPFLSDTGRFLMDSTVGIGGLFDPASRVGLPQRDNDFGITLGTWGAGPGPYLVLPFVGPSDVRDAAGRVPDWFLSPTWYISDPRIWVPIDAVYLLDLDARTLIPAYDLLQSQHPFDEYAFARNAYLQRRAFLIHGSSVKSEEQQELELEQSLEGSDSDGTPAPQPPSTPSTPVKPPAKGPSPPKQ